MLEFRKPLKPGEGVQAAYERVRSRVPMLQQDRVLSPDIAALAQAVRAGVFAQVEE
jgi:histidine ammonia-lyase